MSRDTRDRQILVRHVPDELDISKTSLDKIMSDYLRINKVCTGWMPKLLTPLQYANRVDCCERLLENCRQHPTGCFGHIVIENET